MVWSHQCCNTPNHMVCHHKQAKLPNSLSKTFFSGAVGGGTQGGCGHHPSKLISRGQCGESRVDVQNSHTGDGSDWCNSPVGLHVPLTYCQSDMALPPSPTYRGHRDMQADMACYTDMVWPLQLSLTFVPYSAGLH